jgi:hypothetical protein
MTQLWEQWAAITAGLILVVAAGAVALVAQRRALPAPGKVSAKNRPRRAKPSTMIAMAGVIVSASGVVAQILTAHPATQTAALVGNSSPARQNGTPIVNATPDPTAPVVLTSPADGAAVGRCLMVTGTGEIPPGESLVIANQREGDDQRYFEADVSTDPRDGGSWSTRVTLGDNTDTGPFMVYAVLMDKHLADELSSVMVFQGPGNTWWASSHWPIGANVVGQAHVTRNAADHCT